MRFDRDEGARLVSDFLCRVDALELSPELVEKRFYISLLRHCGFARSVWQGKRIHGLLAATGSDGDTIVANTLVQMYSRCGYPDEAQAAFHRNPCRNAYSWSSLFAGCAQNGDVQRAKQVFDAMPAWDTPSFNGLVAAYSRNSRIQEARMVFDAMPSQDAVSWNTMVTGYAANGQIVAAMEMFSRMPQRSLVSYNAMVQALAQGDRIASAAALLDEMPEKSTLVCNSLVSAYAQKGDLQRARVMFDAMAVKDLFSWNLMMAAYCSSHPGEARSLFDVMPGRDIVSWNSLLSAYAKAGKLQLASTVFDKAPQRNIITWTDFMYAVAQDGDMQRCRNLFDCMDSRNIVSWNSLVVAYGRNGQAETARQAFDRMPDWSMVSWTALVGAHTCNRQMQHAKEVFDEMPSRTTMSWNSLITGYFHCGDGEQAAYLFDKIPWKEDSVSWSAMVAGYSQLGQGKRAMNYFNKMTIEGVSPDEVTFISALDACGGMHDRVLGGLLHEEVSSRGMDADTVISNAVITMYGKCGLLTKARQTFDAAPVRTVASWNALLAAYSQGETSSWMVLELAREMEQDGGCTPNPVTFLVVLTACSHLGLFEEGLRHFAAMKESYAAEASKEHYMVVLDLLARAGELDAAEELLGRMPGKPDLVALTTLLGACRDHQGSSKRAQWAAGEMFKLEEPWPPAYVLLSNVAIAEEAES